MQALALAAIFMLCPVTALWEYAAPEADTREAGYTAGSDSRGQQEDEAGSGSRSQAEDGIKKRVALTFDDGPDAQYTPVLLDGLKERDVKASFFVIGANIEKDGNRGLIKRMHEEGHLIGNHTYRHVDLSNLSMEDAHR